MAALPSPTQVAGKHNAIYEAYYKQIDPKGLGTVEAMNAAKFLKKSGLSDVVLSRIWDLSDPQGRGCLDKAGVFVALKFVSLAQAGNDINMRNIFLETANPPKVGEIPKIIPQGIQSVPAGNTDWTMKITDRLKYEQLFDSLQPVNGLIAGNKVKGVLMESKLPLDTLGKIWDLADQDKDGSLDKHEFTVAMHLVYQALDKRAVPSTLPVELQKPKAATIPKAPSGEGFGDPGFVANFPSDIAPPPVPPLPTVMSVAQQPPRVPPPVPAIPSMPLMSTDLIGAPPMPPTKPDWVVLPQELVRFEKIFQDSDSDRDGLVSGLEIKDVFLNSGVPQNCLAHIWSLCDTNQSGKLTLDQFALAMWLVERTQNGIKPPQSLAPNMIPPSLRGSVIGAEIPAVQAEPQPTYSNPELEMISREIEELARERRVLETDIAQKEADIRIKSGEVRSLQSELDTLAATLKQLENQKGEAQKRLDDLKHQNVEVNEEIAKINKQIEVSRGQVDKIREQCRKQEETINEQETELNSKRSELQKLKDEEAALEKEFETNRNELDNLTKQLQDTQLQISQVKAMVTQLLETQRQMTDALLLCKAAIEANDAAIISDYTLKIEPDFSEARGTLEKQLEMPKSESFETKEDAFNNTNTFASNGFGTDMFANTNGLKTGTTFDDNFTNAPLSGFDDAFNSGFTTSHPKDPFASNTSDPFGDKKGASVTPEPGKDDFGSDPFAILHAPTTGGQVLSPSSSGQKSGPPPRPESPSPALPPKKSKQPPPRPAPPRPLQGPTRPAPPVTSSDAFGSSTGGFADFADFDNQQSSLVPSPTPTSQINLQKENTSSVSKAQQSQITKTTLQSGSSGTLAAPDFREDPFKDYRYEDPFSIKDPFAEDDGDISSEDVFSDDAKNQDQIITNNVAMTGVNFIDNFKINSEHSDGIKSDHNTPQNVVDNFADFDAFSSANNNTSTTGAFDDFFSDAFNDNFKSVSNKNLKSNIAAACDAFGVTKTTTTDKTTKSSKVFEDFNDNFEDDFFKIKLSETNVIENEKSNNMNFAKFDAFGDDFDDFNNTNVTTSTKASTITKVQNSKVANLNDGAKIPDKFAEDYSRGDNFDADLIAVLQRSVADK